jgi:two-component system response regulator YesN
VDNVKVVIVDDEILAIQHIKNLIRWEDYGFEVSGESIHPEKALELCRKIKPDLVFVDIRMPSMNGLEFSKKLLATGLLVKIILLTSYKEFEYAREAVKIGVFDYLLKHEIQAENLISALSRIKVEIKNLKLQEGMIRRQLLLDMVADRKPTEQQVEQMMLLPKSPGDPFLFILLQLDKPFSVLQLKADTIDLAPLLPEQLILRHLSISIVDILTLEAGRNGIWLTTNKMYSQRELEESLFAICLDIQQLYRELHHQSVAIAVSRPFSRISEFSGIFKQMKRSLHQAEFLSRNTIIQPHNSFLASDLLIEVPSDYYASVESCLEEDNQGVLRDSIKAIFQLASQQGGEGILRTICRELIKILDKFRFRHHLPSLDNKLMAEGRIHSASWYTQSEICEWFISMYTESVKNAQDHTLAPYSRKIRQTLAYIHSHYAIELTPELLAEKLGISGDHLRHLFKEETGQTILDYLTHIRMEKAKELLIGGQHKIYEIAEKVGYQSSQYFSQVFRKKMGIKPLDYIAGKGKVSYENEN